MGFLGLILSPLLVFFTAIVRCSDAYQFNVGGRDGWGPNPSENYNHWAQRMRFQINDTLVFKYKKGSESVLVVKKEDYDDCKTDNPIAKMEDGNFVFKFDRSGAFYFISGDKQNCNNGAKMIIVVMGLRRNLPKTPAPVGQAPAPSPGKGSTLVSPNPSPAASTPALTPGSPSPATRNLAPAPSSAKGSTLVSPNPSPAAPTPATAPVSPSPATHNLAPAPSPAKGSTLVSPNPSPAAPTPATTPVSPSPATHNLVPSPSPARTVVSSPFPAASAPTLLLPPTAQTPTSPESSAPTPSSTPADIQAPAPITRSSAPAFTPSVVLVSSVTLVIMCGLIMV